MGCERTTIDRPGESTRNRARPAGEQEQPSRSLAAVIGSGIWSGRSTTLRRSPQATAFHQHSNDVALRRRSHKTSSGLKFAGDSPVLASGQTSLLAT